jgi:hypothetical protein
VAGILTLIPVMSWPVRIGHTNECPVDHRPHFIVSSNHHQLAGFLHVSGFVVGD